MINDTAPVVSEQMTFAEHREKTAADCEAVAGELVKLAAQVREGNMKAFEAFWFSGGTEEGDSKLTQIYELILLRYVQREERVSGQCEPTALQFLNP